MTDLHAVDLGFSRKAAVYDAYCEGHPVIRWARGQVRRQVTENVPPGSSILELNAGTGADAAYLVEHGYRVHATDIAAGMIAGIHDKMHALQAGSRFTAQRVSFTELDRVEGGPYDLVLSNFGGLNCIADLRPVSSSMGRLLRPGGYVVWCIMPPVCPWEVAQVLRGQFRLALRRFKRGGIAANVEGAKVMTWYHPAAKVVEAFAPDFQLIARQSLSLFCPPSYMDRFSHRFPRLTQILLQLDATLGKRIPFHNFGDFVLYTFKYGR